ncbi:hypothetical protein BASA83_002759 [Batrachochytrium salamandrivorans]|nr:hypothetical protein BASA83_002759 [Batrachochytrium salamandrivorans]
MTADQLGVPRLDVTLVMASGYQAPGGLCNKLPLQSTKQLMGANGSSGSVSNTDQINAFAKSWIVDPKNSLFDKSFRQTLPQINIPGTLPAPIPAYHLPAPVPAPAPAPASASAPAPASTQVRATSAAVGSASVSRSASTTASAAAAAASSSILAASTASPSPAAQGITLPPPPPPQVLAEIERSCKALFDIPGCTKIVPADFFIQSCILDAKLSGSYVFSESGKRAYLAECNAVTKYMANGPTQAIVDKGVKVQQDCGFGNRTCINNCSGNGACTNFGCACKVGFAGLDCSMDLSKIRQFDPTTKVYKTDVNIQVIVQQQKQQVAAQPLAAAPKSTAAPRPAPAPAPASGSAPAPASAPAPGSTSTSASAPGSTSAPAPAPGSTSAPAPAPASESDDESAPAPESDDESAPAPASAICI